MITKNKIRSGLVRKKNSSRGSGCAWGYEYAFDGRTYRKQKNDNNVYVYEDNKLTRIGFATNQAMFIQLVFGDIRSRSIAGELLAGGVTYSAASGSINNRRGDKILWIAELQEALKLEPKSGISVAEQVEKYQDDLGKFIVEAINTALK